MIWGTATSFLLHKRKLILDGFNELWSFFTVYSISSAEVSIDLLDMPIIEPMAAGWDAAPIATRSQSDENQRV